MIPEESKYTLDEITKRVHALLTRAESDSATPAEAALCRHHAERLMRQWRIKEETALAEDPFSISPTHREIQVTTMGNEFLVQLASLIRMICQHSDVWMRLNWRGHKLIATLVGFEVDIRQAEWLFSSARLHFRSHLEPELDPALSEQENVYRFRRAGMLRKEVAERMWGVNTPSMRTKAQRLYLKECAARGETPQLNGLGTDAKTFREAYARGFVDRISHRLRMARDAADSQGGVVVLAGRTARVREAYYDLFPDERPSKEIAVPEVVDTKKYRGPTKAQLRAAERRYFSPAARAGEGEGKTAANDVEIKRVDSTPRIGE